MIIKRYLSRDGWVNDGGHSSAFDAYLDARRRCVVRGRPYALFDEQTGATLSILTVKQCLEQYGIPGDFKA